MLFAPAFFANLIAPSISSTQSVNFSCAEPAFLHFVPATTSGYILSCPRLLNIKTAVSLSAMSLVISSLLNIELPSPCTHTTARRAFFRTKPEPIQEHFFGSHYVYDVCGEHQPSFCF